MDEGGRGLGLGRGECSSSGLEDDEVSVDPVQAFPFALEEFDSISSCKTNLSPGHLQHFTYSVVISDQETNVSVRTSHPWTPVIFKLASTPSCARDTRTLFAQCRFVDLIITIARQYAKVKHFLARRCSLRLQARCPFVRLRFRSSKSKNIPAR